jgi:ferrochelatase
MSENKKKRKRSAWYCSNWAARIPPTPSSHSSTICSAIRTSSIFSAPGSRAVPLARYIARKRATVVREHYDAIGGHSPIRLLTERQARALEAALAPHCNAKCFIAMRYWNPLSVGSRRASERLERSGLVLLPLYPQYSFRHHLQQPEGMEARLPPQRQRPAHHTVETFYDHPLYVQSVAEKIALALTHFDEPDRAHIVFSAHGLPLSLIERGDPYARR